MPIKLCEATKLYPHEKALAGVTLEFEESRIYGLFGGNGAGKSTLLDVIAGRTRLGQGGVFLDGEPVFNNDRALERIALARPGEPFPFGMRVRTAFKETALFRPIFSMERALGLAEAFGIDPDARIASLSTGRATLLRCACAMASGAPYVLLDEPALGVDAAGRKTLYREIVRDFAESGRTYVIASHHIDEMASIIDHAAILQSGEVADAGPVDEMLAPIVRASGPVELVAAATDAAEVLAMETTGQFAVATMRMESGKEKPGFPEGITVVHAGLQDYVEALCGQKTEGGN